MTNSLSFDGMPAEVAAGIPGGLGGQLEAQESGAAEFAPQVRVERGTSRLQFGDPLGGADRRRDVAGQPADVGAGFGK